MYLQRTLEESGRDLMAVARQSVQPGLILRTWINIIVVGLVFVGLVMLIKRIPGLGTPLSKLVPGIK